MLLTRRRKQFLGQLAELYGQQNEPVHYGTLAAALGVSKWTAYDMLKEIEKMGCAVRSYAANGGETGRTQVRFVPTPLGYELLEAEREETAVDADDWEATRARLLAALRGISSRRTLTERLRKLKEEVRHVKRGMEVCAYSIGVMLMYLYKTGGKAEEYVRHLVSRAPTGEIGMTTFAGAVLGTVAPESAREIGAELAELAGKYLRSVTDLSEREKVLLSDFLLEALV
ncbi:Lrp/AsnC family transcriptional regulator [Cohnella zeiphila]|uniref:Lrp/AsnC family transcriptional regulator n=1 Tax=Cohnella zeiphila TaxID=2761120 RepID=A0A7X0SJE5_9BACL|nr:Lrp/AsnC family transcriptional regulator [Cohnella zeiphila]MBB6731052.1 Lrp/AsnC family transcriptional regulator [Cohnella zeiphila]